MYKGDVPVAKAMQVEFHQRADLRVATAEGFWSARWMQGSLLSNLDACGIVPTRCCSTT